MMAKMEKGLLRNVFALSASLLVGPLWPETRTHMRVWGGVEASQP